MLDEILPGDLEDVRLCEPGCGAGPFLVEAARRICKQMRDSDDKGGYLRSLRDLTGFDTDRLALSRCRSLLTATCREILGDKRFAVQWNLVHADMLVRSSWKNLVSRFQYVCGNPPYVRIQNLENHRRNQIVRNQWNIQWSGSFDLYYLFFDAGLDMLAEEGILSYITPSSWLKTVAGRSLRNYLKSNHQILRVIDFGHDQVFDSVTTYTAITTIRRCGVTDVIPAARAKVENSRVSLNANYEIHAEDDPWSPLTPNQRHLLRNKDVYDAVLADVATISVGIQTLADRVFVLNVLDRKDGILTCTDGNSIVSIEEEIVRRIVKASVFRNGADPQSRVIIYPYDCHGALIGESKFRNRYPLAFDWLSRNRSILESRDKGKCRAKWYAYGRDVGITSAFGKKILTSGMNKFPNFQVSRDERALYYSGYGIKPREDVDFEKLLSELNSERMDYFIQATSRPYRNGWYSYAKTFIQQFPIAKEAVLK